MSARWKRNAVVAVMAVLVCSAVALNWLYTGQEVQEASGGKLLGEAQLVSGKGTEKTGEEEKTGEGEQAPAPAEAEETGAPPDEGMIYTGSDYFASARLTRQQARDNALSLLQEAAEQENADAAVANEASQGITPPPMPQIFPRIQAKKATKKQMRDIKYFSFRSCLKNKYCTKGK